MEASNSQPSSRRRGSRRKAKRSKVLIALIGIVVVAVLALGAMSAFKIWRQGRTVKRAQELLEGKDYAQAMMSATWALQLNPTDAAATRVMADASAAEGKRQGLFWRQKLVDLEPTVLEHRLTLAREALRFGEMEMAETALAGASEAQKKGSSYHEVAGQLAARLRKGSQADANIRESLRLDPNSEQRQLELAALELGRGDDEVRAKARAEIQRLAGSAKVSRSALHVLTRDALLRGDSAAALGYAEKLNTLSAPMFEDRIRFLRLLKDLDRREFWWCLAQMKVEVMDDEKELPALMTYLNKIGFPEMTVEWSMRMPEEKRTKGLVPAVLAEAALLQKDWEGLDKYVKFRGWGSLEFQRLALHARALRETGDLPGSAAEWKAAVAAASGHPEDVATLAKIAISWKWQEEANAVLWDIARGSNDQMPALQALSRTYQLAGNSRELLSVANRMLEIDEGNLMAKNNVAYLSLLLDVDKERAHALAKDAYSIAPTNAAYVSTYALSQHLIGRTVEGLKLMEALQPREIEVPSIAFCYGIILAAAQKREEAPKYLAIAESSSILFPQERALIAKAREWLAKP